MCVGGRGRGGGRGGGGKGRGGGVGGGVWCLRERERECVISHREG